MAINHGFALFISPRLLFLSSLHIPSELVYADYRRAAVRVRISVSCVTKFVWDLLLPPAPRIVNPPPNHRQSRVIDFSALGSYGPMEVTQRVVGPLVGLGVVV